MSLRTVLAGLGCLFLVDQAHAAVRHLTVSQEVIGSVEVVAPAGEPKGLVILLSDADGVTDLRRSQAEAIAEQGVAAAIVSTPTLLETLRKSDDDDCHYPFGEFEDLSQIVQRTLAMQGYRWPVLLGFGMGGTLAYLSASQAPLNTAAGAVSVGVSDRLASRLPMCDDHERQVKVGDGEFQYPPRDDVPGRWIAVTSGPDPVAEAYVKADKDNALIVETGGAEAMFAQAMKAAIGLAEAHTGTLDDLPIVELPADGKPRTLAVFYSGDGGWRDIDKQIADYLSKNGVAVIGVDSLRYFWSRKTPEAIATDLGRIIAAYNLKWGTRDVALVGYSFGAGVIPFAYNKLPPTQQRLVRLMALLALDRKTSFEISVSGFLGVDNADDVPVGPQVKQLDAPGKVVCFYGADEDPEETGCLLPELAAATLVRRPGKHHFDGEYEPIAQAILDRIRKGV
jgi:type IV secretory pathway VirJ component